MLYDKQTAKEIAARLLQIKAIQLNLQTPYTWASGWKSPIYCDNRKVLSYPAIRNIVKDSFAGLFNDHFPQANTIAGVATAGIPHGAILADVLQLPFIYVRSSAKAHGMQNKIEGTINENAKVLVIEDLISTGKSSLDAVQAIRNAGAEVCGLAAIFTYGFPLAAERFKEAHCECFTLSDYETIIQLALDNNYISENEKGSLNAWRNAPDVWVG